MYSLSTDYKFWRRLAFMSAKEIASLLTPDDCRQFLRDEGWTFEDGWWETSEDARCLDGGRCFEESDICSGKAIDWLHWMIPMGSQKTVRAKAVEVYLHKRGIE